MGNGNSQENENSPEKISSQRSSPATGGREPPNSAEVTQLKDAVRELRRDVEMRDRDGLVVAGSPPGNAASVVGKGKDQQEEIVDDELPPDARLQDKFMLYPRLLSTKLRRVRAAWHEDDRFVHSVVYTEPNVAYMRVTIYQANNVPVGDLSTSDPYVILRVDGVEVARTEIRWNTLNPVWQQSFVFPVAETHGLHPEAEQLVVEVWDYDDFSADDLLSSISIPFQSLKGYDSEELAEQQEAWYLLNNETLTAHVGTFFSNFFSFGQADDTEHPPAQPESQNLVASAPQSAEGRPKRAVKSNVATVPGQIIDVPVADAPCIRLGLQFDHGYEWKRRQLPVLGQLTVDSVRVNLFYKLNDKPFSPYVVLRFGTNWVRLRTQADKNDAEWEEDCMKFVVHDPAMVLMVGVFSDRRGFLTGGADTFMGKIRVRLSSLVGNQDYHFRHRLVVPREKGVKQKGEIELRLRYTYDTATLMKAYFQPPLPAKRYELPSNEMAHQTVRHSLTGSFLYKQNPPIRPEVLEQLLFLETDTPKFHAKIAQLHATRVQEAIAGLGANKLGAWFNDVCYWKRPWYSVLVNAVWLYYCYRPRWILPSLVVLLLYAMTKNYYRFVLRRPMEPPAIDINLMGGLILNNRKLVSQSTMEDTRKRKRVGKQATSEEAKRSSQDAEVRIVDDAEESSGLTVLRRQLQEILALGPVVQAALNQVACGLEQVVGLGTWADPRMTLLLLALLVVVFAALFFVPLWLVFSVVGLAVLRHPCLRDPLPPPPVNMLARLPVRADRLIFDKL